MSSYKKIKEVKCIYCSSLIPVNLPSCLICKLYFPKTNVIINNINLKDIYIINLEKDSKRLLRFRQFLKYYNISLQKRNWNRFNAIDGYDLKLIHDTCKLMTDKNIIPIFISGGVVFDGQGNEKENDERNPINIYGKQKVIIENFLFGLENYLIIRPGRFLV